MESNIKEGYGLKVGKIGIKKESINLKSEKGYLMLSTLFLLILSGIMTQSIIKISTNHIIQLNQISANYQAKTALNLTEAILTDRIVNKNQLVKKGTIVSSVGKINILKKSDIDYQLVLIQEGSNNLIKNITINSLINLDSEDDYIENKELNSLEE